MSKALRKQQQRLENRQQAFNVRLNASLGIANPPMEGHVRNQFARGGMKRPGSMNPKKGWSKRK